MRRFQAIGGGAKGDTSDGDDGDSSENERSPLFASRRKKKRRDQDSSDRSASEAEAKGVRAVNDKQKLDRRLQKKPRKLYLGFERDVMERLGDFHGMNWTMVDWWKNSVEDKKGHQPVCLDPQSHLRTAPPRETRSHCTDRSGIESLEAGFPRQGKLDQGVVAARAAGLEQAQAGCGGRPGDDRGIGLPGELEGAGRSVSPWRQSKLVQRRPQGVPHSEKGPSGARGEGGRCKAAGVRQVTPPSLHG